MIQIKKNPKIKSNKKDEYVDQYKYYYEKQYRGKYK